MKFPVFFQIVNETYETHETLKSFSKNFGFFVSTGGYSEYFRNFAEDKKLLNIRNVKTLSERNKFLQEKLKINR